MSPSSQALASCLYEGTVRHLRRQPFRHEFHYRLFLLYLDLDELPRLFQGRWLWSADRPALAWFRRGDHLGDPGRPLIESVRELLAERLGRAPAGPIRLLTHLRYFGFVMNPVSFYYAFDASGQHVEALLAEVHNTPWGEQHCYAFDVRAAGQDEWRLRQPKEFHVSPFLPMDFEYRWRVSAPRETLRVRIENHRPDDCVFEADLRLQRRAITGWRLQSMLLRYPWMTGRVFAGIYWQALRLWWRGATYFPHPGGLRLASADDAGFAAPPADVAANGREHGPAHVGNSGRRN
jgi:hypothetical protein